MPKPTSSRPRKSAATAARPAPARRWLLKGALLLCAVAGLLAGIIALGRWGREQLRDHERYQFPVAEIGCEPPPGLERAEFLEQVRYYASLPAQVSLLDEKLPALLTQAFAEHPWVETVDAVTVAAPRQVRVQLTYRRPVLAVAWNGSLRAVDASGVLLPRTAPTRGLPVYPETPAPPRGREGKRWGDPNLEQAARKQRPAPG